MSLHTRKQITKPNGKKNNPEKDPNSIDSIIIKSVSPLLIPQPLIAPITRKDTILDKFRQARKRQVNKRQENAEN